MCVRAAYMYIVKVKVLASAGSGEAGFLVML